MHVMNATGSRKNRTLIKMAARVTTGGGSGEAGEINRYLMFNAQSTAKGLIGAKCDLSLRHTTL